MKNLILAIGLYVLTSVWAHASILTFDGIGTGNVQIPDNYGDRISSTLDANSFQYGEGNGFTPNITVSYAPSSGYVSLWSGGYGELVNALGHGQFNVPTEIVLTADSGFLIALNSFDIAGFGGVDYQTQLSIWDDNGSEAAPNLFNASILAPGANSVNPLASPLIGIGSIHIYVDNIGSTGIDNLNFDQTVVPAPPAIWLLGTALAGIGSRRWLRRRLSS